MKTKTEHRMEKALYKISEKMYFDFSDNFGYAFQGSPLTMFIYDFEKDTFHDKEVLKIRLWQDKYKIFKRLPSGDYKYLGSTTEASKLYSYIKKACNGH